MTTAIDSRNVNARMGAIRPTYGYYRQPNGWIKPAVITPMEELKYRQEGWVPLPQYGRFDMGTEYTAHHPLELLFMNGGANELCEDQIRQQGLYMNPPLVPTCGQALTQVHKHHNPACWNGAKPVHFPQVANMKDLGPFPCRFCSRQLPTVEGRDQHEGVMHKEEKGSIRTGETLADGLVRGLGGQKQAQPDSGEVALLRQELKALKRRLPRKARRAKAKRAEPAITE